MAMPATDVVATLTGKVTEHELGVAVHPPIVPVACARLELPEPCTVSSAAPPSQATAMFDTETDVVVASPAGPKATIHLPAGVSHPATSPDPAARSLESVVRPAAK